MTVRACPVHGLALQDLRCPKRHRCTEWHVVQNGQVIGRGSEQRAVLFRGALEPDPGPEIAAEKLAIQPRPNEGPCLKGHNDWKIYLRQSRKRKDGSRSIRRHRHRRCRTCERERAMDRFRRAKSVAA